MKKKHRLNENECNVFFVFLFQRLLTAQNRRIDQLVEKIKQQQEKLEKQSLHLQALQNKVSGSSYTETSSSTVCIFSYFRLKSDRIHFNVRSVFPSGETEESEIEQTEGGGERRSGAKLHSR